jgi:hypothetical protein
MKTDFRSTWVIVLLHVLLFLGCDTQPYRFEIDRISHNLDTRTNTNEITAWFEKEVGSASSSRTNPHPAQVELKRLPPWAEGLFGDSPPKAELFLDLDEKKSHINLLWAHGRGMVGVIIGGEEYKPKLGVDFFVKEYAPRIFVYTPKHFP